MFSASVASNDDELQLSQDDDYKQYSVTPSIISNYKKKQSLDPSYAPVDDEPDSPETFVEPVAGAQKRKYEAPEVENDAPHQGQSSSSPLKKPHLGKLSAFLLLFLRLTKHFVYSTAGKFAYEK